MCSLGLTQYTRNIYHKLFKNICRTFNIYRKKVIGNFLYYLYCYLYAKLARFTKKLTIFEYFQRIMDENVKNIELYNFNFKDNYVNTNDRHQLGFIAQEVQQIYPKAVEVSRMIMNLEEKIDDLLTLNTKQIDYTLYGAVKCLIQKLENIKIKMEQIKTVYNITT